MAVGPAVGPAELLHFWTTPGVEWDDHHIWSGLSTASVPVPHSSSPRGEQESSHVSVGALF